MLMLLPLIGLAIGENRRAARFGETPDIGVRYSGVPGEESCQLITGVVPKAHHNWLGQAWQDADLSWGDVRIEREVAGGWEEHSHNQRGTLEVGQKICGLSKEERWRWVYIPDAKTIALDPI